MELQEILDRIDFKLPTTFKGRLFKYMSEKMHVVNPKVEKKYQRNFSKAYLIKGGELDLSKLTPIVVCYRPDSFPVEMRGYWIIDGQHRAIRIARSEYDEPVPFWVYEHPRDRSIKEVVEFEANLFYELNSLGKKPTKLDECRSGIYRNCAKSKFVLECMEAVDVVCDENFGSLDDKARCLEVFYHFYLLVTSDYAKVDDTDAIVKGRKLMDELYPNEKSVNGYFIRACCLLAEFIDELPSAKGTAFKQYLKNYCMIKKIKSIVRGRSSAQSPRFILWDILKEYKANSTSAAEGIGDATIDALVAINKRFADPNQDS